MAVQRSVTGGQTMVMSPAAGARFLRVIVSGNLMNGQWSTDAVNWQSIASSGGSYLGGTQINLFTRGDDGPGAFSYVEVCPIP